MLRQQKANRNPLQMYMAWTSDDNANS